MTAINKFHLLSHHSKHWAYCFRYVSTFIPCNSAGTYTNPHFPELETEFPGDKAFAQVTQLRSGRARNGTQIKGL